jgi:hypothetical protein
LWSGTVATIPYSRCPPITPPAKKNDGQPFFPGRHNIRMAHFKMPAIAAFRNHFIAMDSGANDPGKETLARGMRIHGRHYMNHRKGWAVVAMLGVALVISAGALQAGLITSVTEVAGNDTPINLVPGGLEEGVLAFTDRTHILVQIPQSLAGADLVQVSNNDRSSVPYQLDVTMGQLGLLYIGLDNRVTDGDNTTEPTPMSWMLDPGMTGLPVPFTNTGYNIGIDESADGTVNQQFSLFVAFAPAGTYSLFEQNNGTGRNNYIVFASKNLVSIPEPSTVMLSIAGLGLLAIRRRRRG